MQTTAIEHSHNSFLEGFVVISKGNITRNMGDVSPDAAEHIERFSSEEQFHGLTMEPRQAQRQFQAAQMLPSYGQNSFRR